MTLENACRTKCAKNLFRVWPFAVRRRNRHIRGQQTLLTSGDGKCAVKPCASRLTSAGSGTQVRPPLTVLSTRSALITAAPLAVLSKMHHVSE